MSGSGPVVVVGAGQAAAQLIGSLRAGGYSGALTLVGSERHLPYHRPPLSKQYLAGEMTADKLLIRRADYYERHGVAVRLGVTATAIDRAGRQLCTDAGDVIPYATLVLATGGRARRLPNLPTGLANVHVLRTREDAEALNAATTVGCRVTIVGGGYVGLEVAASLIARGCQTTVLELADRLLARSVSPVMSTAIAAIHADHGCRIRCGEGLAGVEGDGRVAAVITTTGRRLETDVLVIGAGMQPNIELAQAADLACANGIIVDESCRSSDPAIYAIGDVAVRRGPEGQLAARLESIDNAVETAKAAAAAIAGIPLPEAAAPWFWSHQYDVRLQMVGLPTAAAQCVTWQRHAPPQLCSYYLENGRLQAAQCLNAAGEFMRARRLLAAATPVDLSDLVPPGDDVSPMSPLPLPATRV